MELSGQETIAQSIQKVWEALNDPGILKECIPGCEEITQTGDNEYKIVLLAAVGPVRARFSGKLQLADLNPPSSYSLMFEGAGGAAGFTKGAAQVSLSGEGGFTKLTYRTEAKIGGKIAQVGARLIDGVAAKTAADFFARFNRIVGQVDAAVPMEDSDAPAAQDHAARPGHPAAAPVMQRKASPFSIAWWLIPLVIAVAIGFYVLR
jgi:carbon monoxide dehydrogenase subunit G